MGLAFFMIPALLCVVGSFVYFATEPRASSVGRALIVSLHGLVTGALTMYTALQLGSPHTGEPREVIFLTCLVLPPILVGVSVVRFRGPKAVHAFLLPVGLCYLQIVSIGIFVYLKARM